MKRYVSASTKSYNKDQLLDSIYYLFDNAVESAGVSSEEIKITKITVKKDRRPVSYMVSVDYDYKNQHQWILLFGVPINQDIPEDYWITADSGEYLDKLLYTFDTSKIDDAKQAFAEFCGVVDSIGAEYGLTYECEPYPRDIDKLNLRDTFIDFYAKIVDAEIDDPDIECTYGDDYDYDKIYVTDKTSGDCISMYGRKFSVMYRLDKGSYVSERSNQPLSAESAVSAQISECRSKIDDAVARLQGAPNYLHRLNEIASLLESIPGITVKYSENLGRNPYCRFEVTGPFGTTDLYIDDVFKQDDKKLVKNMKARIRRYNSSSNYNRSDPYSDRSETLFTAE